MTIINRIYEIVERKSIKLTDFANYLKIPQSTISGWKRRQVDPPAELIIPIAMYLKVSPLYLLTGKITPGIKSLSDDESLLIDKYRLLDEDGKMMVLATAIRESRTNASSHNQQGDYSFQEKQRKNQKDVG